MYNSFISQEKNKEQSQKCKENIIENLFLLFVVIARQHVGTQSTQGTLALEHA